MKIAHFHFPPGLRLLLPLEKRDDGFELSFRGPQSIKHLIESMGVPHTEIGGAMVNEESAGLGYIVHDGDRIEVQEEAPEICQVEPRFILDGHLGRLAAHLRMLGLDCLYRHDYNDSELAKVSAEEDRILLTRDRRLLMQKIVTRGRLLRSLDPDEQLREVIRRYQLVQWIKPFRRCLRCNHPLEAVEKEAVLERLEPLTRLYFDDFRICPACGQIYWKGSHYEKMQKVIEELQKI
ncbi:MAG: Mut7-C RNAse domain-containing protein [Chloroflexota bacterium]